MSRYIQKIVLLLLLFISQFTYSQIYPVQAVPVVLSPYSSKLSDYSNPMVNRINLQLITTDLLVTNRPALLFVKIQGNGITAQSAPVLSGINPIYLNGGEILSLTSADIAGYFRFQNLQGLTTTRYSDPLPDGVYTICFQVYDLMTKKWLSQNSCATVYLMLNDPPQLNLPSNNEQIPSTDFPNIVFSWTPRHLNATNVSYEFELKEILNTSLDPVFAFEVSPLLLKEENLRTSTLLYDVSKPTLIPGKTYAWRVKAVSTNGLAENAVFKNNGYSQVFSFKYTANCSAPRFLLSEQQSRSGVKLMWQGENSHKKYHVQYRKANVENAEWFEVHTINTQTLLQGLEAGFTYEFRVGASCEMEQYGTPQSFVYSGIQTFTINKEENSTSYNCGIVPKIEITNQQPLGAMVVHETFMAGDFPVKVLEVTGSNGIFSGSGYIQVPYLFDTRIGVEFNNVRINSDYQLIDGVVETTYDPDWSNVDFVDDLWDVNQQSETVDFPINSADDITVSPGGDIVVTGPDGQTETFPGGKDTVITDSTGKSYYVDAEGNVSGPHQQADGGKPTPENTDGVDKNGEVTALTAEGIKVTFAKINNETQYAFDLVTYGKELTKDYKKVDGLFVPFKAIPNGLTDKILAKVTLSGTNVVADSLFFKTQNGVKIDAVKEGEHFVLTLKGAQKFAVEEVQATIKQGDKYKIAGVFNLVHVSPRTVKLKLVPTSSSINVADKIDEIKAIYKQLAINVQVDVVEPFDISGYLEGGKLPTENEFGDLSTYSDAQKAIINDFTKQRNPEQAYYIFVTNAASSTGQGGYMALGNQFGFVFNQSAKTIAHEFGHGALRLEHPFKQYKNKGLNKGDIPSIMDYANGTEFLFTDWKQINDPKFRLYAFQEQSEGEHNRYAHLGLTPNGKIIDEFYLNGKKISIIYVVTKEYTINKIEYQEVIYEWNSDKNSFVNSKNEEITIKKINKEINKVNLYKSRGDGCKYDYVLIDWSVEDEKSSNTKDVIESKIKTFNANNWKPALYDIRDASCSNNFAEEILSKDAEYCTPENVNQGVVILEKALTITNGEEVAKLVNSVCLDAVRKLSYSKMETIINTIGSQDKLIEFSELAILRVMSAINSSDYHQFYTYLEKDNNKILKKFVKEFHDASLYFWTDKKNYTSFIGALVTMFNQNPASIADRWPANDDDFAKITVNLKPISYENSTQSPYFQIYSTKHNDGDYKEDTGEIVINDVYTTHTFSQGAYGSLDTDEPITTVSPLTPIILVTDANSLPLIATALGENSLGDNITIVPAIFLKYKADKIRNQNIETGIVTTLDVVTIAASGGTALATKVHWIRRAWALAEVVGAVGNIAVNTGNVSPEVQEAVDAYNNAMFIIGVKNVAKGGYKFATTLPKDTKKLLQENKSIRNLLSTQYLKWKILTKNLDNISPTEKQLIAEQEQVWKSLGFVNKATNLLDDLANSIRKNHQKWGLANADEADEIVSILTKNLDKEDAEHILSSLDELVESGATFTKIKQTIAETGKHKHFGDGSKWTLKYLTDNKNLFKGKTLEFELPANIDDLGMRYFDVADISDANKILFYEFKSVIKVPPAHFADQFLKDLTNKDVTSLDQIKWIFDGKKLDNLPQDKFIKALESSKSKLFNDSKIRKMLEDELKIDFDDADELIDVLKNNKDWFNKIFTISRK